MTFPLSRRPDHRRRPGAKALAAAGLLAAVFAPAIAATPASADPHGTPAGCAQYGAAASGDLMTLRLADLRPLGLSLPPAADLTLASARAGLAASTGATAAQARYTRLGTTQAGEAHPGLGPLDAAAYQIAPPATGQPVKVNPTRLDLGLVRAGTGELTASAKYRDHDSCHPGSGAVSAATTAVTNAAVLPGTHPLATANDNLSATTRTGLVRRDGRTGAEAAGTAGLVDLNLLGAVTVHVVHRPTLTAVAAGAKSSIGYEAPILEVGLNGHTTVLDQPGESTDLAVPAAGSGLLPGLAALPVTAPGGKLLPGLGSVGGLTTGDVPGLATAGKLVGGLPTGGGTAGGATGGADGAVGGSASGGSTEGAGAGSLLGPVVPGLPALQGIPAVGGLLGGTAPLSAPNGRSALVLRLTAGEVSKETNSAGVHAKAISLRVKLLLVTGSAGPLTLVDLCIGVLEVAATAPADPTGHGDTESGAPGSGPAGVEGSAGGNGDTDTDGGYGGDQGGTGPESPAPSQRPVPTAHHGDTPSRLPTTGMQIGMFVGAGMMLLGAGRLLMLFAARRRSAV